MRPDIRMPEASAFESLTELSGATRKSSNMSTSSDDSLRKISNDSGISISSSQTMPPSVSSRTQFEHFIGEPRLSSDLSTAVLLAQQQSISAAAALNPAMFGLMSAGLGGLWGNPLAAAAMLQQEAQATTRKMMESAGGAKTSIVNSGKHYPKEPFPMYPGFTGLMQPNCANQMAEQLALSEALRSQLLSRKLSEDSVGLSTIRPTRKANSFSGSCSSPLMSRRPSPPVHNTVSPNVHSHHLSPNINTVTTHSGDEQQQSPYGDEDSTSSTKSSVRSRTPQPQASQSHINQSQGYTDNTALPNHQHLQPAGRKRKNGIIGSLPMAADLSAYSVSNHPAFPLHGSDNVPMHKLSTASLPANLPSAGRNNIVQDQLLNRDSPATSRKRQRNVQPDEKVGLPHEDESYWERRRKNNEAAKRSRDSRRAKEDEIAIRAAFLEQENLRLRVDLNKMKEEFSQLKTELNTYKKPEGEKKLAAEGSGEENITLNGSESTSSTPTPPAVTNGYTS